MASRAVELGSSVAAGVAARFVLGFTPIGAVGVAALALVGWTWKDILAKKGSST